MASSDEWALFPALTLANAGPFLKRLKKAKPKIFKPGGTNLRLVTVPPVDGDGPQPELSDVVTDDQQLGSTLQKHIELRGETFIFLSQDHSWAPFNLSEEALQQIVTAIQPRPEFLRLFNGFGPLGEGCEADFSGGYFCRVAEGISSGSEGDKNRVLGCSADFAYALRYVAKTGRSQCPWSERRMGVYHKFDGATSVWVIMQPTPAALGLPKAASAPRWREIGPALPHVLLFQSSLPAWVAYLKYLEGIVRGNSREGRLAGKKIDLDLAFSSVQELQYHSELLYNTIAALRSDTETLLGLQSLGLTYRGQGDVMLHHELATCVSQFRINQKWAEDMLDRAKQASSLMTVLFYAKHSEALTVNTTAMSQLAQDNKKEQEMMLEVAKAAKNDSEIMKVIAAVTLFYLPATLMASLFSTGFVTPSPAGAASDTQHQAAIQAVVYTLVTASLTALTLLSSYSWYRRSRTRLEQASIPT